MFLVEKGADFTVLSTTKNFSPGMTLLHLLVGNNQDGVNDNEIRKVGPHCMLGWKMTPVSGKK
jgi:hypothetical protein